MKKMVIMDPIRQELGFEVYQDSEDIRVFTAYSNVDVLNLHRENKTDLIITELYGTGMNTAQLCSEIREAPDLKDVSVIVCCRDNHIELSQSRTCRANMVLTRPTRSGVLQRTVQQLLTVPARAFCRIPFSARCAKLYPRVSFQCEAENISLTGMLIKAKADLNRGDRLNFSLKLPYMGCFEAEAEVIRTVKTAANRHQYGLRFSRLEPTARYAIKTIVEQQDTFQTPGDLQGVHTDKQGIARG